MALRMVIYMAQLAVMFAFIMVQMPISVNGQQNNTSSNNTRPSNTSSTSNTSNSNKPNNTNQSTTNPSNPSNLTSIFNSTYLATLLSHYNATYLTTLLNQYNSSYIATLFNQFASGNFQAFSSYSANTATSSKTDCFQLLLYVFTALSLLHIIQ